MKETTYRKIIKTLSLLNSMILSGEVHSHESSKMHSEAIKSILEEIEPTDDKPMQSAKEWLKEHNPFTLNIMANSVRNVIVEAMEQYSQSQNKSIQMQNVEDLRDKFFNDLTRKREDGVVELSCSPHNVFEWIKPYLIKQVNIPNEDDVEYTIGLLEAEIDSLKESYKESISDNIKTEYSMRILSHKKALKIIKQSLSQTNKE